MNRLLLILILTLNFQSFTKADDIRDFQIEGVGIYESLLNYMTEEEIKNEEDNYLYIIISGIISGIIVILLVFVIIIVRNKQKNVKKIDQVVTIQKNDILDLETIFKLKSDLREDDKELVKFIFNNNGEALESELRKKFLQPRTTMWRAVKRLEREGVVEIQKKDLQNLVKLRKNMEEET